jgi:hypothetical protein
VVGREDSDATITFSVLNHLPVTPALDSPFPLPNPERSGRPEQRTRRYGMSGYVARAALGLAGAALITSLGVTSVMAATGKTTYEAVAGNFSTQKAATNYAALLAKHGLAGLKVQSEKTSAKGLFQVEQSFTTMSAAQAEVAKIKAAHYRGGVEIDTNGAK